MINLGLTGNAMWRICQTKEETSQYTLRKCVVLATEGIDSRVKAREAHKKGKTRSGRLDNRDPE